jgi:hypothetical protein
VLDFQRFAVLGFFQVAFRLAFSQALQCQKPLDFQRFANITQTLVSQRFSHLYGAKSCQLTD